MTETTSQIEREVEQTRDRLENTVDALKDKMSPGQLIDEFSNYLRNGNLNQGIANFGTQVRDNPMPLALIGAGIAWLAFGERSSSVRAASYRRSHGREYDYSRVSPDADLSTDEAAYRDANAPYADNDTDREPGIGERISDGAGDAVDYITDGLDTTKQHARRLGNDLQDRARDARQSASHYADELTEEVHRYGERAHNGMREMLDNEPLVIGAVGVAVGAALGAVMPSTRTEDRVVGPYRDEFVEKTGEVVQDSIDDARDVASEVLSSARAEADREGLHEAVDDLADKGRRVVQNTIEQAEKSTKDKLAPQDR